MLETGSGSGLVVKSYKAFFLVPEEDWVVMFNAFGGVFVFECSVGRARILSSGAICYLA